MQSMQNGLDKGKRAVSIPCRIEYEGPARVDEYFCPRDSGDEKWPYAVSFRGRPWKGFQHVLEKKWQGFVLRPEGKRLDVVDGFNVVEHYEWDPSGDRDKVYREAESVLGFGEIVAE